MAVNRFFTKIAVQKRKASSTGNAVEAWIDVNADLKCAIAPINPNDTLAFPSDYFRTNITHKMFCWSGEDIRIDDKLVYENDEYLVKKINDWDSFYEIFLSEVK